MQHSQVASKHRRAEAVGNNRLIRLWFIHILYSAAAELVQNDHMLK